MSLSEKPPFAEVCGCVLIVLNTSQQDRYDRANLEQRKHLMEVAYRAGADCIPLMYEHWPYLGCSPSGMTTSLSSVKNCALAAPAASR